MPNFTHICLGVSDLCIAQLWYCVHTTKKSIKWLFYEKLHAVQMANRFSVVFTIRDRPKTDQIVSKLAFLEDMSYNFYLDNHQ